MMSAKCLYGLIALIWLSASLAAKADMTLIYTDSSSTSPSTANAQQKFYFSGTYYRGDNFGYVSYLYDSASDTAILLMPSMKCFVKFPKMDPNAHYNFPKPSKTDNSVPSDGNGATHNFVDTGRTTVIDGYTCRHYVVTTTMSSLNYESFSRTDILVAQDLLQLDPKTQRQFDMDMSIDPQVKGIPVRITAVHYINGRQEEPPFTRQAQITFDPIPASTFQIPNGYLDIASLKTPLPRPGEYK